MTELERLKPIEAAKKVLEDILSDTKRKAAASQIHFISDDFDYGNRILNEAYNTPMAGTFYELNKLFMERLYYPLEFIPISTESKEFPPDRLMIEYVGQLARLKL
jgi:hypothetical protein